MTTQTPPPANEPSAAEKALVDAQKQIQQLQAEQARLNAKLTAQARQSAAPPAPSGQGGVQRPADRAAQLEQFANEQARRAQLLEICLQHDLKPEDFADIDYQSPGELALAAKLKVLERQAKELGQSLETKQKEMADKLSAAQPPAEPGDTGGPTGEGSPDKKVARVTKLREMAKATPRTTESRWMTLQAAYLDPTRVVRDPSVSGTDDDEE